MYPIMFQNSLPPALQPTKLADKVVCYNYTIVYTGRFGTPQMISGNAYTVLNGVFTKHSVTTFVMMVVELMHVQGT